MWKATVTVRLPPDWSQRSVVFGECDRSFASALVEAHFVTSTVTNAQRSTKTVWRNVKQVAHSVNHSPATILTWPLSGYYFGLCATKIYIMASRAKGDDDNEPQEDDELTQDEQYDMDKMNSTTNGLTPNGRPSKISAAELRNRLKIAKSTLMTDRHYQIHAILLLIILFLGIILIYVSAKLLAASFAPKEQVCHTGPCLRASARVVSNVNLSIDACDNFFQFSCGNWKQSHQLTDNQAYYSVSQQVTDQIYDDLRRYLDQVLPTSASNDPHYKGNNLLIKLVYYKSLIIVYTYSFCQQRNFFKVVKLSKRPTCSL